MTQSPRPRNQASLTEELCTLLRANGFLAAALHIAQTSAAGIDLPNAIWLWKQYPFCMAKYPTQLAAKPHLQKGFIQ